MLGAGPTGLGAAWRLARHGYEDVSVIEQADEPGGLAGSERDAAGFTWDFGGHVQFSHYETYDAVLDEALGEAWCHHERTATIRLLGRDVPYPFQHHLDALPEPQRTWASSTLAAASGVPADDSFASWLQATFGDGVCQLFLEPYNRKVWQHPLDDMSATWLGERVARPAAPSTERPGGRTRGWGPNATFRYPRHGGTGAIWRAVARLLPAGWLRTGSPVTRIDIAARQVWVDGQPMAYDTLISTLPLDVLAALTTPLPDAVHEACAALVANTVELVGIGVDGEPSGHMRRRTWMYFPESTSPYYRVTVLSNYSPGNAPDGQCYSLLTESSHPRATSSDTDDLVQRTCRALVADGLVPPDAALRSVWHKTLVRGYPVPTRHRDAALATIHAALEPHHVYSRGRFGGWKYEVSNQDHSFMQGVEVVDRLLGHASEITYPFPSVANSGYAPASPPAVRAPS